MQAEIKNNLYKITEDSKSKNPLIEVKHKDEVKMFTPEQITTYILTKMKETAGDAAGG